MIKYGTAGQDTGGNTRIITAHALWMLDKATDKDSEHVTLEH